MQENSILIQKILVCLDGSQEAEQALPWAEELAAKHLAEITLLRVGRDPNVFEAQDLPSLHAFRARQEEKCRQYLQQVKFRLKSEAFVQVSIDYTCGSASQAIVERAAQLKASVIVMSSHGRDGASRWWMGSVAEKVTRHSPCPVFLIRSAQ